MKSLLGIRVGWLLKAPHLKNYFFTITTSHTEVQLRTVKHQDITANLCVMSFHFFRWKSLIAQLSVGEFTPSATSSFTTQGLFRGSSSRPCLGCSRSSLCRCCKGEKGVRQGISGILVTGESGYIIHHYWWFGWFGWFGFVSFKHIPKTNSGSSTNLDISWEFSEGHSGNLSVSSSSEKQSSWEKFRCREMAREWWTIRMAGRDGLKKNSNVDRAVFWRNWANDKLKTHGGSPQF